MIPCPRDGCDGEMKQTGFTKKIVDQNCPDCGRFRNFIVGDMPRYYCPNCMTIQDIETSIKLYICSKCKTLRPENRPDLPNNEQTNPNIL